MKRIEIICDATIEDEMKHSLHAIGDELYYTSISPVTGRGAKGPRQGDAVWPEQNTLFIIYSEVSALGEIRNAVYGIRERFPQNGIAAFAIESAISW
jgi:nitrogen regulatory protein PII